MVDISALLQLQSLPQQNAALILSCVALSVILVAELYMWIVIYYMLNVV
jgi:hypothetical protein